MTHTVALSPLFRRSVGFDRINDMLESALRGSENGDSYSPYNIEKHGDDHYRIVMALAGFRREELSIITKGSELTVSGRAQEKEPKEGVVFLHRGIAARAFEKTFSLADHVRVTSADYTDGRLVILLERLVPEEQKPKMIEIGAGESRALEVTQETN